MMTDKRGGGGVGIKDARNPEAEGGALVWASTGARLVRPGGYG